MNVIPLIIIITKNDNEIIGYHSPPLSSHGCSKKKKVTHQSNVDKLPIWYTWMTRNIKGHMVKFNMMLIHSQAQEL